MGRLSLEDEAGIHDFRARSILVEGISPSSFFDRISDWPLVRLIYTLEGETMDMGDDGNENGWGEWKRLVLDKLETQEKAQKELTNEVTALRIHLEGLRTRVAIMAGIAGAVVAFLADFVKG